MRFFGGEDQARLARHPGHGEDDGFTTMDFSPRPYLRRERLPTPGSGENTAHAADLLIRWYLGQEIVVITSAFGASSSPACLIDLGRGLSISSRHDIAHSQNPGSHVSG